MGGKGKEDKSNITLYLVSCALIVSVLTFSIGMICYMQYRQRNTSTGDHTLCSSDNATDYHGREKRQVNRNTLSKTSRSQSNPLLRNVNPTVQSTEVIQTVGTTSADIRTTASSTAMFETTDPTSAITTTEPTASPDNQTILPNSTSDILSTVSLSTAVSVTDQTGQTTVSLEKTTTDSGISVDPTDDNVNTTASDLTTSIYTTDPVSGSPDTTSDNVNTTASDLTTSIYTTDPVSGSPDTTSDNVNTTASDFTTSIYTTDPVSGSPDTTSDNVTGPENVTSESATLTSATDAYTSRTTSTIDHGAKIAEHLKQAQVLRDFYSSAYKKLTLAEQQGPSRPKGKALKPLHYDIEVRPNIYEGPPENFTLDGYVRIKLLCLYPTNNITLRANGLTIKTGTLGIKSQSGRAPAIVKWEVLNSTDNLVIYLKQVLIRNEVYFLRMNYNGPIGRENVGLHLEAYNHTNKVQYVASARASPSAREFFPCINKPGERSTFSLTIVRRNPVKSISIMPLARIELRDNGWLADVYKTTPPLTPTELTFTVGYMNGGFNKQTQNVRVPLSLYPVYYDIELRPNMYEGPPENFTFDGFVNILLRCDEPTSNVTLHTNKLNIANETLRFTAVSGSTPSIVRWEWDKERQFMIIYLDRMLVKGRLYVLKMNYTGPLTDDLSGLYLSKYQRNNQTVYISTTQFQPTHARKAFPCLDEPAIKSYFYITLVRRSHMKSLSNMPIARMENRGGNWVADVYQKSPKMSTYLLAFIVCDFDYMSETTRNIVLYRAWARPESVKDTAYSLQVGVLVLTHYEDYFYINYPLPKLDMIAVPDFGLGGMENWGLIIYKETAMLFDPAVSSETNKQRVAQIVAHELAHQWFGNLVTPSWWDDLWLNVGFATFVEYMGTDYVHPEWKMLEQFVYKEQQDAFDADGLVTSHPMYVPVSHPDEINEIFDAISYSKGASIIRMMRFFLGELTFRDGLSSYLKMKAYGSAFHDDLWSALTEQSIKDGRMINVKKIMDTWTLQMNYPVVMVTRLSRFSIRVTQQRYLRDPNAVDPGKYKSDFGYKWTIPFTYTSSKELRFNKTHSDISWLHWTTYETVLSNSDIFPVNMNGWILANPMQYGYYRVNYDVRNWRALIHQLKIDHLKIVPVNRAQIINDALNLANSDLMPMDIALQTLEYIDQELDYVPRAAANKELDFLDIMLPTGVYGAFESFMKSKIARPFSIVGMNDTGATHLQSLIRSMIVKTACDYGIKFCIDESIRLYNEWMYNPRKNPIDPDLRDTVYCTAIKYGGMGEWDFAFGQYRTSTVVPESARLLAAMGCSRDAWILTRYMKRALDPNQVRKQDALNVIIYVTKKPAGRKLAWEFFETRWDEIRRDFGGGLFTFPKLIRELTASFNTPEDLARLQTFIDTHPDQGSGKRAFEQALEQTMANIRWINTKLQTVKTWLGTHSFRSK